MQNRTGSIKAPAQVQQGGTFVVTVDGATGSDVRIEVAVVGHSESTTYTLVADGTASVPVPPVPGGTLLTISVGSGPNTHSVLVEVVSSFR